MRACVHAQSCPTLWNPLDCSSPGFSVPGILQARIVEGVAMPSSRGSFQIMDQTQVSCISCIGTQILYHWATWEAPHGCICISKLIKLYTLNMYSFLSVLHTSLNSLTFFFFQEVRPVLTGVNMTIWQACAEAFAPSVMKAGPHSCTRLNK